MPPRSCAPAREQARQSVRALRSLLVEIYPPSLRQAGLASALSDLVAPVAARGVETRVDVPEDLDLDPEDEALLFRVAQESVRNAVAHAGAHRLTVAREPGRRAHRPDRRRRRRRLRPGAGRQPAKGTSGSRCCATWPHERGAKLSVDSAPGAGTRVTIEAPRR